MAVVVPFNRDWAEYFEIIKEFLGQSLEGNFLGIEHIGSTSIPGMVAKPIIDIDIVIAAGMFEIVKAKLENAGYIHQGDKGLKGRESFRYIAGKAQFYNHHLYVLQAGNIHLRKHLAFKDYLIKNPELILKLSEYKIKISKEVNCDRKEYQKLKEQSKFLQSLVEDAMSDPDFQSEYFDC